MADLQYDSLVVLGVTSGQGWERQPGNRRIVKPVAVFPELEMGVDTTSPRQRQ